MMKKQITSCLQYDYIYRLLFFKSAKTKRFIDKKEVYNILSDYRKSDIDEMLTFWISEECIFDVGDNIRFPTKKEMDVSCLVQNIKYTQDRLKEIKKKEKELKSDLIKSQNKLKKIENK